MLPLMLALAASGGALLWHLQRRRSPRLALSFARLMPEPQPSTVPERRFSPVPPLRSPAFWLRMAALGAALAVLLVDLPRFGSVSDGSGIGLLMVIDTGDTMRIADGGSPRIQQALVAARQAAEDVAVQAGAGPTCADVTFVGSSASAPVPLVPGLVAAPQPAAPDAPRLIAAARLAAPTCAITHAVVFTDLPRPAGALPEDLPPIFWHQIGPPLANAGLREVLLRPAVLTGSTAQIEIRVEQFPLSAVEDAPPVLHLTGPGGRQTVTLGPAPDSAGAWLGRASFGGAGAYLAELETAPDAWDGDDRLRFELPAVERLVLDWQVPGLAPPPGVAIGAGGLFVGPVASAGTVAPEGPALLVYDGWSGGGAPRPLGAFVEDPLISAINLDVLEAKAPAAFAGPLPPGFAPVLQLQEGAAPVLARRGSPPGVLVPAPAVGGDSDVAALSLTLFYSALADLAQVTPQRLAATWQGSDGRGIAAAWRRSNLARPLSPPDNLGAIRPGARHAAEAPPGWPWAVVAVLVLLALERLWALSGILGRARHAV